MIEIVYFQFMYLARPHCKVREKYLEKLMQNIQALNFPQELENGFLTVAIKSFGAKLKLRQELCHRALDALDCLKEGMQKDENSSLCRN